MSLAMAASSVGTKKHWNVPRAAQVSAQNDDSGKRAEAVIVGAGPAGCLMAINCIKRGFHVHLFERRSRITNAEAYVGSDSRSYPMLLTCRASQALERADVKVPASLMGRLLGSCLHLPNGNMKASKYSSDSGLISFGVSRNGFVGYLQDALLSRYPNNVSAHFGWELSSIDDEKCVAVFRPVTKYVDQAPQSESIEVHYDLLVGADGVSSKTRAEMLRLEQNDPETPPLTLDFKKNPESYKSFYVHPTLAKTSPLYAHYNYVQSWPALNMLLVGMADGSFWGGSKNPKLMNASSASEIEKTFREKAPEVYDLLLQQNSNFPQDYLQQPAISFGGAVILSRFHRRNIVLIGDAAHAMFPSYGTGGNAALEDCQIFDQILEELETTDGKIDCNKAAAEFTNRRVEDAHAIVEMNSDLRLFPRGLLGVVQATLLMALRKILPSIVRPTSYQLLWSHVPFRSIKKQKKLEDTFFYAVLAAAAALVALLIFKVAF